MSRIDIKSLIIGFLAALSLYLLLGQTTAAPPQVGRYQLVPAGGSGFFYMMDTTQREAFYSLGRVNDSTFRAQKINLVEATDAVNADGKK